MLAFRFPVSKPCQALSLDSGRYDPEKKKKREEEEEVEEEEEKKKKKKKIK